VRWLAAVLALSFAAGGAQADEPPPAEDKALPETVRARESIVVTATRTEEKAKDAPPGLVVVSAEDLERSAAPTLDDSLRLVPGFTLFRRTGSRVANPTTQGVSLRGLGPSGASRALVLVDGLPLNDPFGGWIYWGRVPSEGVERVEVLRGGASDLYGSAALGGVIQVVTRPADGRPLLSAEASVGNEATAEGSLSAGGRKGDWGGRLSAGGLTTDGYVLVDDEHRGPVDTAAGARYATADLRLERWFPGGRAYARGRFFGESRKNGTPLQTNDTRVDQAVVGALSEGPRLGSLEGRLVASTQVYDQSFSAVSADRTSEALTRTQRVPAQDTGVFLQWSRPAFARHVLLAGTAWREVRGSSDEVVYTSGVATSTVGAGGRERTFTFFVEDIVRVGSRWQVRLSAAFTDLLRSRALSTTTPLVGGRPPTVTHFDDVALTSFDPRIAASFQASEAVLLSASAYRAFRSPTLNELYRSFRVGDTLTLANPDLHTEDMWGGEAGVRAQVGKVVLAGTAFWNETKEPVANVTLTQTSSLITRQRQNLGRTRAAGFEASAEARFGPAFFVGAGYAFTDGVVASFPPSPELVGNLLPQLARHQGNVRARYEAGRLRLAASVRLTSDQFEDDRNSLVLPGFASFDLQAAVRVTDSTEAFVAVENGTGERYLVGLTPLPTVGPPRLVRAGVRARWGRDPRP